jgi:predicted ATPase
MSALIRRISIRGFKSIRSLHAFELGSLSVLIGANGAGKSNFLDAFRFIHDAVLVAPSNAASSVAQATSSILYSGTEASDVVEFELETRLGAFSLSFRADFAGDLTADSMTIEQLERLSAAATAWRAYHFNQLAAIDTDSGDADGARLLSEDGSNLSLVLEGIRVDEPDCFDLILDTVRLVAPFVADLVPAHLTPDDEGGPAGWVSTDGARFTMSQLSDGTLRFLCIAVALMQPDLPDLLILDEPELGLHPLAVSVLADMIHAAADRTQVIVSTQSPSLLDHMRPEDVILVNRSGGQSTFERLDLSMLEPWMSEYTLGELWQKNVLETGPQHE